MLGWVQLASSSLICSVAFLLMKSPQDRSTNLISAQRHGCKCTYYKNSSIGIFKYGDVKNYFFLWVLTVLFQPLLTVKIIADCYFGKVYAVLRSVFTLPE